MVNKIILGMICFIIFNVMFFTFSYGKEENIDKESQKSSDLINNGDVAQSQVDSKIDKTPNSSGKGVFIILGGLASFLIIIIALFYSAVKKFQKRLNDSWKIFAEEKGLSFTQDSFSRAKVTGNYKGFDYSLYSYSSDGESGSIYTNITISLSTPNDFNFHIHSRNILSNVFGKATVHTGDERFDFCFIVDSNKQDKALQLLTPDIRRSLLNCKDISSISISSNSLTYSKLGVVIDIAELNYISEVTWAIAQAVTKV